LHHAIAPVFLPESGIVEIKLTTKEMLMFLFIGVSSGLLAFGLLGGAVWAYFSQRRKLEGRVAAVGTVVELTTQATTRSSIFCPVVEFTASSGKLIRFTSEFGSRPAGHTVGQSVNVRYDAADPHKAEIESKMTLWLAPLILVFLSLIACCLSAAFLGFYLMGFSPS
jgi:hypothetical protein